MPSFAPNTVARSQPMRPVRCRSLLPKVTLGTSLICGLLAASKYPLIRGPSWISRNFAYATQARPEKQFNVAPLLCQVRSLLASRNERVLSGLHGVLGNSHQVRESFLAL